ncbi:efflux RND transporter periplasmic adaptor subunit [Brevundimonas naejangsanensis]|uniref:efflux RND transporter periplasmic adaptor subunit n=1 Tax=Brevundimonas naejangsanensis TaxID=588932 RepID=UPI00320A3D73
MTTVQAGHVQLSDSLPGRVVAFRTAEIRAQVGGIVQRKLFTEGAVVRAGQPLFQINAAPFRAEAESASAALQRAVAIRDRARLQAERLAPLLQADAVSRQAYDNAAAELAQAQADVAAAQAALARRHLDVGFATVTAPISGRIGASTVTEGALVGTADAAALATIHQINQVYVDVRQPASRLEALRDAGQGVNTVDILDSDGKPTGMTGRMLFSELSVDPATGDVTVRVLVDNASQRLLPGMFVRARLPRGAEKILPRVPQQAVVRAGAQATVMVLAADGKAVSRPVELGDVVDGDYVVLAGLKAGERVIVEGQDRVQPDQPVVAEPWKAPSAAAVSSTPAT